MNFAVKIAVAAGMVLIAGTQFAAAETRIDCPLQQAERTIVNKLPQDWWTTPIVDRLSETKIMNIGGQNALVCVYGNSGSVQRNAPAGQSCQAVSGGFVCGGGVKVVPQAQIQAPQPQQAAPAAAKTFSTGAIAVKQTYLFDLDRGSVGNNGADIWFELDRQNQYLLSPSGGAQVSVSGGRNRGYEGCRTAKFSAGKIPLAKLAVGTYVCVRTNEGRISEFRYNALEGTTVKTLKLGYTTWQ